jgi:hypothetical protein
MYLNYVQLQLKIDARSRLDVVLYPDMKFHTWVKNLLRGRVTTRWTLVSFILTAEGGSSSIGLKIFASLQLANSKFEISSRTGVI